MDKFGFKNLAIQFILLQPPYEETPGPWFHHVCTFFRWLCRSVAPPRSVHYEVFLKVQCYQFVIANSRAMGWMLDLIQTSPSTIAQTSLGVYFLTETSWVDKIPNLVLDFPMMSCLAQHSPPQRTVTFECSHSIHMLNDGFACSWFLQFDINIIHHWEHGV